INRWVGGGDGFVAETLGSGYVHECAGFTRVDGANAADNAVSVCWPVVVFSVRAEGECRGERSDQYRLASVGESGDRGYPWHQVTSRKSAKRPASRGWPLYGDSQGIR